jgi:integrase
VGAIKIKGKWAIEYYDETGKRKRKVIEKTGEKPDGGWYEAAKKEYRSVKNALDKGEPLPFTVSKKTFAQMAEKYWETCRGTWSPIEALRVRGMLDHHLLPFFGAMKLAKIRRVHIDEYVALRQQEGTAPAGINKERVRLHHLFAKCIAWEEVTRNPCSGMKKLKEPPERVAYLEAEERQRLLDACMAQSATLHDIVAFAMLTGARLSEILNLRWGNVDLRRRIISFRKTKSGKVRHVPISQDLYALLMRMEPAADPDAPLFDPAWNGRWVSTAFRRVASGTVRNGEKVPGVKPGFRFHDLRHDFASWLTMGGVNIRGVQTLLGHSDLRMTERYSHLADRVLAAAVEVLPALPAHGSASRSEGVSVAR